MKKIFFLACVLSLSTAFNAIADIRGAIDEFGKPIAGSSGASDMCTQLCQGYSATITECPEGYEMLSCESVNCANYHKCEASPCAPGYDRSFKDCMIVAQPDNYQCTKCK